MITKYFCLFLLLIISINIKGQDSTEIKIKNAIESELKHFPEATLIDIYKNFFQDEFGPGHIIPNDSIAENYLVQELTNATQYDTLLYQTLGYRNNYYRLNLKLLVDGIIPFDEFLTAFIGSANKAIPPTIENWRKEWKSILNVIEPMELNLENYENDKLLIDSLLTSGNIVVHHSKKYSEMYYPHYRIVHKEYFKIFYEKYLKDCCNDK